MTQKVIDSIIDNKNPSSFSSKMRLRRFSLFLEYLNVTQSHSILDVGGTVETWIGSGLEKNVTLLNLSFPENSERINGIRCVRGDALDMSMFGDRSFDVLYSNSVIEHVGCYENQMTFAKEIQRVGISYWVQTPNRHFPIEPHFLFPFFQYLPVGIQKKIATNWKYSHLRKWGFDDQRIGKELSELRLLDKKELLALFGGASLYKENVFGLVKSLVAYRRRIIA